MSLQFLETGSKADYKGLDVKGKVALDLTW